MRIPLYVKSIIGKLEKAGYDAFIVGGSVRDMILKKAPKDWDIATSATPEKVQEIFPDSFYTNTFGTVGVKIDSTKDVVQITTFRKESNYSDKRHPDQVAFSKSIEEDLSRRDFSINAIALKKDGTIIDPYSGASDIKEKIIKSVGDPSKRFSEDALRLLRAIRFSAKLNFDIEKKTLSAINKNVSLIKHVSQERIGQELLQIFETENSNKAIELMRETGLLKIILPEVALGIGVEQNKHHIYDVYHHNLYSLKWADEKNYPVPVKIAAMLHDVGKPQTKKGEGPDSTFYGHDILSSKISKKISDRLRWSKELKEEVALLIYHHMFYYNIGEVTEKSIRRLVARVGSENMDNLVKLRICDRMGSGVPKPEPYRLRHFQFLVEKVQQNPLSISMLKINGNDIMKTLNLTPGPKIGNILFILFDTVLDEPKNNNKKYLLKKAQEINEMSDKEILRLKNQARQKEKNVNQIKIDGIKKKYYL